MSGQWYVVAFSATRKYLQQLRWQKRRWTLKHIWYRSRLRVRRRRWTQESIDRTQRFVKNIDIRPTIGPALVVGDFSGSHGLSRGASYDIELLRKRHKILMVLDIGPFLTGKKVALPDFGSPVENLYLFCQPDNYAAVFSNIPARLVSNSWRIGRWVWETPVFPEEWRFAEKLVHEVWTPSEFCAQTFRSALDIPVVVVPHAVVAPRENCGINMRLRLGLSADVFVGLAIMDIRSCPERKNPWEHVRFWKRTFGDNPNAILVMKVRVSKRTRVVLEELKELIGRAPNIRVITDEFTNDEIAALHHIADLYLSLHRSEGFGLNICEALSLGKFVVATNWSANAEYGPSYPNYIPVPYKMIKYRDWMNHYSEQKFKWADPIGDFRLPQEMICGMLTMRSEGGERKAFRN